MTRQSEFPGFDDGKEPGALRTIGEVAAGLGVRQHVLRYWEEQFPMLRPIKRSGGRRYYRPEDVSLIATIHRLVHTEGYTLRGARIALEGGDTENSLTSRSRLQRLMGVRDRLAAALAEA